MATFALDLSLGIEWSWMPAGLIQSSHTLRSGPTNGALKVKLRGLASAATANKASTGLTMADVSGFDGWVFPDLCRSSLTCCGLFHWKSQTVGEERRLSIKKGLRKRSQLCAALLLLCVCARLWWVSSGWGRNQGVMEEGRVNKRGSRQSHERTPFKAQGSHTREKKSMKRRTTFQDKNICLWGIVQKIAIKITLSTIFLNEISENLKLRRQPTCSRAISRDVSSSPGSSSPGQELRVPGP